MLLFNESLSSRYYDRMWYFAELFSEENEWKSICSEQKQGEKAGKKYDSIRSLKTEGNLSFMCQKCHPQISFA